MAVPTQCFALVATRDRWELLTGRALPSIARQVQPPDLVVLVNDGKQFDHDHEQELLSILAPLPVVVFANQRSQGAAGAWNSGLDHLRQRRREGFVAILDDDDSWDPRHLAECVATAHESSTPIVVSGLRRVVDGIESPRRLPGALADRDFLVGNPGWQGSNTFVALSLLERVGGFRDGMQSLNDRDLAIRLLRVPDAQVSYTEEWTSSWHQDPATTSVSTPRSPAKISGLRWFWRIYGEEMSAPEKAAFFKRAQHMFGVTHIEIVEAGADVPLHTEPWGNLHVVRNREQLR